MYATRFFMVVATGCGLLLVLSRAAAQNAESDTSFYPIFEKILEKYHNEEYDEAIQLAKTMQEQYPDSPAGPFSLLATYQTLMRNYRVRTFEAQYNRLLGTSIKLSQKAIKKNKKDGRNYFYLGCAYGSRSIYYARRGKWLAAFNDGSKVLNNFKKALAYSPDFYDAYYGLGLYKYWLGAKAKFLKFLPFSKGQKHEGMEQIKFVTERGRFLKIDAMYGLTTIYINEGEYEKALELSNKLYQMFPNNPSLLYKRGRIYQALERWDEALRAFENLYALLKTAKYQSTSYQIEGLYQMAKSHYHLGNYLDAQRLSREAIALEKDCDFARELNGPIEKFSEIKKQLHKLNKKVEALEVVQLANKASQ
jgi:tetratricopeptide (TPR) repeat protein